MVNESEVLVKGSISVVTITPIKVLKMKKFPILKEEQVAVVIADGATGHVLNLKLELYMNDSKDEIYYSFNNIDLAKEFVKKQSISNDKLEFLIYDKNQTILEYVEATHRL